MTSHPYSSKQTAGLRFGLCQIAEGTLEGELSVVGFGRNMDLRTGRKRDEFHQCSGRLVLKRTSR